MKSVFGVGSDTIRIEEKAENRKTPLNFKKFYKPIQTNKNQPGTASQAESRGFDPRLPLKTT